ncbi:MAG: hypothetical protein GQ547_03955 [Methylophaga sp.]|nr:hypothetical protein [Methylophaga sp.]
MIKINFVKHCVFILMALIPLTSLGDVYKFTDSNGTVHYDDHSHNGKFIKVVSSPSKKGNKEKKHSTAKKSTHVPQNKRTSDKGKWQVREDASLIDDSENVYLSITANELVRSGYNRVRPVLYIRCAENITNVYIMWNLYLGLETTRMLTRFDKQMAITKNWSISSDTKAVFVRGSKINFAKELMSHDKLLAKITPYNEAPVIATFDIAGLWESIKPLRQACHW